MLSKERLEASKIEMDNLYLQKIIAGDVSQFAFFIEKYKDMAFSIAFRITNDREDAEEIVQDSFLKAFKSLNNFRTDSKFSTWFYRIVVNNSLSEIKKSKIELTDISLEEISETTIENIDSAYQRLTNNEQKKIINLALNELKPEDRLLLTLYYLNENTLEEINEITGISRENLKMKIHRARKKMYIALEQEFKTEIQNLL